MDTIKFQNIEYKIREIKLPELGNVFISTTCLNDALINNGTDYVSKQAQSIDDQIYFFVEVNEIEMNETELIKLVALEAV